MLKGILLDFDGTIADTRHSIEESLKYTVERCLGRELSPEEIKQYMGIPLADTMRALSPSNWGRLVEVYLSHNLSNFAAQARLFPGTIETLRCFKRHRISMGLVSSKRRLSIQTALDLFGIGGFFDVTICAEDVQRHKPDPEGVLLALDALGLKPYEAAMVGDSPYDVLAGRAAGTVTVAAMWGMFDPGLVLRARPDMVCSDIAELQELIT